MRVSEHPRGMGTHQSVHICPFGYSYLQNPPSMQAFRGGKVRENCTPRVPHSCTPRVGYNNTPRVTHEGTPRVGSESPCSWAFQSTLLSGRMENLHEVKLSYMFNTLPFPFVHHQIDYRDDEAVEEGGGQQSPEDDLGHGALNLVARQVAVDGQRYHG